MSFAESQLRHLVETYPDYFPMYTVGGKWVHGGEAWTNWCEGFLGGQLWLLHRHTGDPSTSLRAEALKAEGSELAPSLHSGQALNAVKGQAPYWRAKAEHYSRLIEHRKTDRNVHDLGFLFWPTWKRWYDLTGDPAVNAVVIEAGKTLSLRFQEKGQYLRSFVADESLFIDIMMNVGIIFYAAQSQIPAGEVPDRADRRACPACPGGQARERSEGGWGRERERQTGDAELFRPLTGIFDKARQHCLTTRRYLVRGDGSTAHEGIFDTVTGQFLRQSTHQGWRDDSSWARGLAWALYGFGTAYSFTADTRFLQTAQACADFYIERTPAHGIPPNDWEEPNPALPYESSAAAIAASGMLNLAKLTAESRASGGDPLTGISDETRARLYRDYALRILDTLTGSDFLAVETPGWEGILKHGIYHRRKGLGVDESVMWGDYFFLEAVCKALGYEWA